MKAVRVMPPGGWAGLQVVEMPKPEPEPDKILVKMMFAAVNPGDLDAMLGHIPFAKLPPLTLGSEGSGIVEHGNEEFPFGTQVMVYGGMLGIVQDGTWQEYINVPTASLRKLPVQLTPMTAAGLTVGYLTAQAALIQGEFKAGMATLVTTVGGSVGNAAYQLALLQGASPILTTAGSLNKASTARGFKYQNVISLSDENLEQRVQEITGGKGLDFVIDTLGGAYLPRFINVAAPGATVMLVGYKAGLEASINIMPILAKQIRILGTNVFALTPDTVDRAMKTIFTLIERHDMKPLLSQTFHFTHAEQAIRYMEDKRPFGKVLLQF